MTGWPVVQRAAAQYLRDSCSKVSTSAPWLSVDFASAWPPRVRALPRRPVTVIAVYGRSRRYAAVTSENVLNAAVSRVNSRDSSPCLSACSSSKRSSIAISSDDGSVSDKSDNTIKGSDKEAADSFKLIKRKTRKVARRPCAASDSDFNDSSMEVENFKEPVIHSESPASPALSLTKTTIAAPKQTTIRCQKISQLPVRSHRPTFLHRFVLETNLNEI
ncbi:hypothetical protein EVAR_83103_1 [Eumeta japonica]|uniref:Uncharacterized protein n=1 Tax=Eumeta variegata TaxID=151549 RepID=A0A4C1WNZ5_EUMVA|nr:hypothetical protein EVAR_83103_1 [Eumeta japonica]